MPESYTKPESKTLLFDVNDDKLRIAFNTIVTLYGEENALKMVKIREFRGYCVDSVREFLLLPLITNFITSLLY